MERAGCKAGFAVSSRIFRPPRAEDLGAQVRLVADDIWRAWARFLQMLGADARAGKFRTELTTRATDLGIALPPGAI